ncbi:MAG: response regulator transcription factor [Chloroflexi bacterium]|nr:response regulator transcription factor [Chloroflexota bacterium]
MVNLVVADDQQVIREGLCSLLGKEEDFHVVGEASNGHEAVDLVRSLHPDVLVADVDMEGMSGIEVAKRVKECSGETAVVILSMHGTDGYVRGAMQAGARGYVLKRSPAQELIRAIREAASGGRYLSRALSDRAVDLYVTNERRTEVERYYTLTVREREVLEMVVSGVTSREIAAQLVISTRTVEFHRANIMRKIGLRNQNQLIRYCVRIGIPPNEGWQ